MTLNQPVWLVLAIPLAAALWHWRLPSRLLQALRCLVVALVVLAMCGPAVRLSSRAGTVVVVADRSLSMPPGSEQSHIEAVDLVQAKRGSRDRLAVVSFGRNVVVELSPQAGRFAGFVGEIDREGSNLAEALQAAVSLIPEDTPGRILVLSDGRFTGTDPLASASRAAARDIAVDYRAVTREPTNDLAILRVDAPSTVQPQESFMITVWVRSPVPQLVRYELRRGGRWWRAAPGRPNLESPASSFATALQRVARANMPSKSSAKGATRFPRTTGPDCSSAFSGRSRFCAWLVRPIRGWRASCRPAG
ncbi:MAG: vWA domain-containing protein [Phycisphaerae bacterium]